MFSMFDGGRARRQLSRAQILLSGLVSVSCVFITQIKRKRDPMLKPIRFQKANSSLAQSIALVVTAAVLFAGLLCARAGVPAEKDLSAYLLVYFLDKDHSLHFALSSDG